MLRGKVAELEKTQEELVKALRTLESRGVALLVNHTLMCDKAIRKRHLTGKSLTLYHTKPW